MWTWNKRLVLVHVQVERVVSFVSERRLTTGGLMSQLMHWSSQCRDAATSGSGSSSDSLLEFLRRQHWTVRACVRVCVCVCVCTVMFIGAHFGWAENYLEGGSDQQVLYTNNIPGYAVWILWGHCNFSRGGGLNCFWPLYDYSYSACRICDKLRSDYCKTPLLSWFDFQKICCIFFTNILATNTNIPQVGLQIADIQ